MRSGRDAQVKGDNGGVLNDGPTCKKLEPKSVVDMFRSRMSSRVPSRRRIRLRSSSVDTFRRGA